MYLVFNSAFLVLFIVFMVTSHVLNKDHRPLSSDTIDNLNQACGKDYSAAHLQKHALIGTA